MSEPLRITCPCGYENWVPEEKRGQTIPCFICGEDILVEEPAAEPPSVPESPAASIPQTPSPRPAKKPAGSPKPRNPFEDDEVETVVRPKFQYAPPTPTAPSPSAPRPRSPFELDQQEAERIQLREEKLVAGPFSLEMGPAPKEDPSTIDQMESLRPKDSRRRHVFIDTISPHDVPTGEKCSQCGRELRGSWDRIETHVGVICYVCSNQGTHDVPARLKADVSARREVRESELITGPVAHAMPVEESPWFIDTKSDGFKTAVLLLACGVLLIAFIVAITGWGNPSPEQLRAAQEAASETAAVPEWTKYPIWAWRIVASFLGTFLAIYLTLDRDNHLPHETLRRNALQILGVMVLLLGVVIAAVITATLLNSIFVAGQIWMMFMAAVFFLVQLSILTNHLDFRIRDFFWLYFFYLPVAETMVYIVGLFLQWGVYSLVT